MHFLALNNELYSFEGEIATWSHAAIPAIKTQTWDLLSEDLEVIRTRKSVINE